MTYRNFGKPVFDLILSVVILILVFPIFLISVFLLFMANKKQVFFVQERPGKNGKIIKVIKFKTMNDNTDEKGHLLTDSERITRLGKTIRQLSIDEIPQLFNVLKGDMSFVGPRPLLKEYLSIYSDAEFKRHLVKPGITGWAQVNGRNAISWKKKFELDNWYVEHLSFKLDIKILILTLVSVLRRDGVNSGSHTTMEKFTGNN